MPRTCEVCGVEYQPWDGFCRNCEMIRDVMAEQRVEQCWAELVSAIDEKPGSRDLAAAVHRFLSGKVSEFAVISMPRKARISRALRTEVYERDRYRCRTCGGFKDLSLDHILPESKGGESIEANLQTLCGSCNSRKGTQILQRGRDVSGTDDVGVETGPTTQPSVAPHGTGRPRP